MPAEPPAKSIVSLDTHPKLKHFSIETKFPVYTIGFVGDDKVVLGGGGGGSRSGVGNRLALYHILLPTRTFNLVTQLDLAKEEDAPMTMAVLASEKTIVSGINSSEKVLKEEGKNENLRVFEYGEEDITPKKKYQTLNTTDPDHYQKITTFSRPTSSSKDENRQLLGIGSTNSQLTVMEFPSMEVVLDISSSGKGKEEGKEAEEGWYGNDELYDVDFNDEGSFVLGTSSKKLCIWSTTKSTAGEGEEVKPVQIIERPTLKKDLECTFRGAKFGRKSTSANLYTIINVSPLPKSRKPKAGEKKSFVSLWDTASWKLRKTRTVSMKPVTAFDVSADGTLLAYGSSDLSVGILDAMTLQPIMTILQAHNFPVTSLSFNPPATLLVSGSADNTVRVINVPPVSERGAGSWIWSLLLTILILLLAIAIQQGYTTELRGLVTEHLNF